MIKQILFLLLAIPTYILAQDCDVKIIDIQSKYVKRQCEVEIKGKQQGKLFFTFDEGAYQYCDIDSTKLYINPLLSFQEEAAKAKFLDYLKEHYDYENATKPSKDVALQELSFYFKVDADGSALLFGMGKAAPDDELLNSILEVFQKHPITEVFPLFVYKGSPHSYISNIVFTAQDLYKD